MSDKYKLVSYKGDVVPSGYTDGTLSFRETILYLKNINMISAMEIVIDEHVDSVLKGITIAGSSISSITNKSTGQTWTPETFSHQLFMSVNKNPDNYTIAYAGQTAQRGFRQNISKDTVERHVKNDASKVTVLSNGKKSLLIRVDREGGSDYFGVDGSHVDPLSDKIKNYIPLEGLEGIDSPEFSAKYDEYISSALKKQRDASGEYAPKMAKSIFESGKDRTEKKGILTYIPAETEDAIEGELSKLFIYASSKGLGDVCEKILSFIGAEHKGTLTITEEDLKGKISPESLDNLLTNMYEADLADFTTYINMVSPRGYGLIHEVSRTLADSGVGELIRQIVTGETIFRGSAEEIRASENIIRAFSDAAGMISDVTAISLLAASPKVNSVLDDIFYLAKKAPTKPVFPVTKIALEGLHELKGILDVDTKRKLIAEGWGVKNIRGDDKVNELFAKFTSPSALKHQSQEDLVRIAHAVTKHITPSISENILKEMSKIMPQKLDGSINKAQDERLRRLTRYLNAVSKFNPKKGHQAIAFSQGLDRSVMANMLSMSRADLLDENVNAAFRSTLMKQEFVKGLPRDTQYSVEAQTLMAMPGLRVEKGENGSYRLYDGEFIEGIDLTPSNLRASMSRYMPNSLGETPGQQSKHAWVNILGSVIGRDKVRSGNADTRQSVMKFGQLAAPLAREIQDVLGFVPGGSSSIKIPEGMTTSQFAESLKTILTSSEHSNVAKLKEYNRFFSTPLIDDYIQAQADVVSQKVGYLGDPIGEDRTVKAGKHIGELLEVSMLAATMLGVIEHSVGSISDLKEGDLKVLHSPGEGDITGDKLKTVLSQALGKDIHIDGDISGMGSIVEHNGKVYVTLKENRDTGAIDGEVLVFSNEDGKTHLEKHQAEFKNSQSKVQVPHLNQYAPHASAEAGMSGSMDRVTVNNTVSLNVITPASAASPTRVGVAHAAYQHLAKETSSTEGVREGSLMGESLEDIPLR